jgi:hypothetical protein
MVIVIKVRVSGWIERIGIWFLLLWREARYGYGFRRIRLTQGQYAIVDPEDYERLVILRWRATKSRGTYYAIRSTTAAGKRSFEMMHRVIMRAELDKIPRHLRNEVLIDHINHNGLDNRKGNLRLATRQENSRNRRPVGRGSSKYKGVTRRKSDGVYIADIRAGRKRIYLGCFRSEVEAAKAYDVAARKYHGEFASLNFNRNTHGRERPQLAGWRGRRCRRGISLSTNYTNCTKV